MSMMYNKYNKQNVLQNNYIHILLMCSYLIKDLIVSKQVQLFVTCFHWKRGVLSVQVQFFLQHSVFTGDILRKLLHYSLTYCNPFNIPPKNINNKGPGATSLTWTTSAINWIKSALQYQIQITLTIYYTRSCTKS